MLFHSSIQIDLALSFAVTLVVLATIVKNWLAMPKLHRTESST